jgi:hypothetical protein
MRLHQTLVCLLTASSAGWGCRVAPEGSGTQSLDNFAGGELTLNHCEGSERVLA